MVDKKKHSDKREEATSTVTEQTVVFFAKILRKDPEGRRYELEVFGGAPFKVDMERVQRIEEHVDPVTGIPVAKVTLAEGEDLETTIKARDLAGRSPNAPFTFGGREMPQDPYGRPEPFPRGPGGFPFPPPRPGGPGGEWATGTDCLQNTATFSRVMSRLVQDDSEGDHILNDD